MCDFKPGDEVVCVDGKNTPGKAWAGDVPVEGCVYTVRGIGVSARSGRPGIWLREIKNGPMDDTYWKLRFRKVQRRDLTEWLSTSVGNTDRIDKRTKVPA